MVSHGNSNDKKSKTDLDKTDLDKLTLNSLEFEKYTWMIINKYFEQNKGKFIIQHNLASFNDFTMKKIDEIISGFNPIEIFYDYIPEIKRYRYQINIIVNNIRLCKPLSTEKDGSTKNMTPQDARQRNFCYSGNLYVDMEIEAHYVNVQISPDDENLSDDEINSSADVQESREPPEFTIETENKTIKNINLGKIPIMVRSKYCILDNPSMNFTPGAECSYDYGGYFIINGNEKVVVSQDRISENKTYVFRDNKTTTYSYLAEIRSVPENIFSPPKLTVLKLSSRVTQFGRYIRCVIHHIKFDVPLFVIFRALGIESDKEIIEYIVNDLSDPFNIRLANELKGCIEESNNYLYMPDAWEYLSRQQYLSITGYPKEMLQDKKSRIRIVRNILRDDFLPHVGPDFKQKALYLGHMVNKLLRCYLGLIPLDDRDSYINKRVDTPGVLMSNLFRQYYGKVLKDMKGMVYKEIQSGSWKVNNKYINIINESNIYKIMKSSTIESGFKYSFATGNWGIKTQQGKSKQGVAQMLNRVTYMATLSHLRRINTPMEKNGKLINPRKQHNTQWGNICPAECFDPDTEILLWNGNIKKVKDIIVGDVLIQDDGVPTTVKSTCSGVTDMYEIQHTKKNFPNITVTHNHILTLKIRQHKSVRKSKDNLVVHWFDRKEFKMRSKTFGKSDDIDEFLDTINDDDVIDIELQKYMKLPNTVKQYLYEYKIQDIHWERKEVELDPYILGMWLGDGSSDGTGFACNHSDTELIDYWKQWAKDNNADVYNGNRYKYMIRAIENISKPRSVPAPLKKYLRKYNLVNNKHIPKEYLINDRDTRLKVLAGLVDTDGHVRANGHEIRITQGPANTRIIHDAYFLAQSLGFSCIINTGVSQWTHQNENSEDHEEKRFSTYEELSIHGDKLYEIPTRLPKRKLNKFENQLSIKKSASFLQSSFDVVKKDEGKFCGFQLTGRGRFVSNNFIILHNTPEGASIGLVKNMAMGSTITVQTDSTNIKNHLQKLGTIFFTGDRSQLPFMSKHTQILVNGSLKGYHTDPLYLFTRMKQLKRTGIINAYTSVSWAHSDNQIHLNTEAGRCVRPVYIVDQDNSTPSGSRLRFNKELVLKILNTERERKVRFTDLFDLKQTTDDDAKNDDIYKDFAESSILEFIDTEETNTSMISATHDVIIKNSINNTYEYPKRYQFLELHPSMMLGVCAINIPFPDHNQSPRNVYECLNMYEKVLMKNGLYMIISKIKLGDEVVTFNPITMEHTISKVINCFTRHTDKKVYKITTVMGHSITATFDHKFMTDKGWIRVQDFTKDTYLAQSKISNMFDIKSDKFKKNVIDDKNNNCYFVKVNTIQLTTDDYSSNGTHMISDITVESNNHSFIAGNGHFMVHNSAMIKQSIGIYASNFRNRMDTLGNVLLYPQLPMVRTKLSDVTRSNDLPYGINVMVAIMSFTGFNQEDSIMINQSAVDRGLFGSIFYKTYKDQCNKNHSTGEEEAYCVPDPTTIKGVKPFNYGKLDADGPQKGFVPENIYVSGDDVIIGKQMPTKILDTYEGKDNSILLKQCEAGYIDRNYSNDRYFKNVNGDGYKFSKIRTRNLRFPVVGDKLCVPMTSFVLTNNGWMMMKDIDIKVHKILTIGVNATKEQLIVNNPKDLIPLQDHEYTKEFVYATDKYLYECDDEELFEIKTNDTHIICTDKHKLYGYPGSCPMASDGLYMRQTPRLIEADKAVRFWWFKHIYLDGVNLNDPTDLSNITFKRTNPIDLTTNHKKIKYTGQVGCLEIPETHVFYYRDSMDSPPCFTGNSSRHGQKGIIGMIYSEEDMPYTADGHRPDIIINPNAIPSRMTIAQVLECALSKVCVYRGSRGDGTPFVHREEDEDPKSEDISKILQDYGCENKGYELMHNPFTGEQITTQIYYGPTYYQRLKHMVKDKMHCLTMDHEVLTHRGWKLFHDLQDDDKVAILKDGVLEYEIPSEKHYYPNYNGKMYHISNSNIDLDVTEEHKMYVSLWDYVNNKWKLPELLKAKDIKYYKALYYSVDNKTFEFNPANKDHIDYKYNWTGPVFCLSVSSEVFLVRRNGKAVWTGNSRGSHGPVILLTHQACDGRAKDGGLRLGEMEVECNWAHGILHFLKERLMECADNYMVYICKNCGNMANVNPEANIYHCYVCKGLRQESYNFAQVRIPYACKLFLQEVQSLNINTKFITQ
jgi:DNA-directed RNA polymerase beta subunit/intein/homing endonuclease